MIDIFPAAKVAKSAVNLFISDNFRRFVRQPFSVYTLQLVEIMVN